MLVMVGPITSITAAGHARDGSHFRNEIRLCKTDPERYELCVRIRNDLLNKHTGKEARDKLSTKPTKPSEDDVAEWDLFLGVAKDGLEIKSKCLSALKTVAHYWGQDVVHDWEKAVTGLNSSMLERSQQGMSLKRRPVRASGDLNNLRKCPPENGLAIDLPDGFSFDKFGLMVYKEYAALPEPENTSTAEQSALPEANNTGTTGPSGSETTVADRPRPAVLEETSQQDSGDDDVVNEVINTFLATESGDGVMSHNQPSTDSTVTVQEELPVHDAHSPDQANGTSDSTRRTLRPRTQPSYREPSGGGSTSKLKQARLGSINVPKIPPRCCPAEVPSALLSSLNNPSVFFTESAEQFSPYLRQLCRPLPLHPHLQLFAERTSAITFAQRRGNLAGDEDVSTASLASTTDAPGAIPTRRRTASLPIPGFSHPVVNASSSIPLGALRTKETLVI
ncbi:hypothetical protein QBC46DRAFT_362117 [Diplogelasinospora grovesii]|uniref:Uncharacterized protein n=1 Tax=Diplogelasinospora grovesii TaxID=303347 RepID=A0AAN6NBY3_9PEZI|nr:hypothetical protein QBC46DRAFT_362117 [Diplogelasinospora grovesii]